MNSDKQLDISNRFKDFVRDESYNFHRWTAILSTVLITGAFAILQLRIRCDFTISQWNSRFFWISISSSSLNVIFTWFWIIWSLYNFYNKYESDLKKDVSRRKRIIKWVAKFWELMIWSAFLIGFLTFIGFLISIPWSLM